MSYTLNNTKWYGCVEPTMLILSVDAVVGPVNHGVGTYKVVCYYIRLCTRTRYTCIQKKIVIVFPLSIEFWICVYCANMYMLKWNIKTCMKCANRTFANAIERKRFWDDLVPYSCRFRTYIHISLIARLDRQTKQFLPLHKQAFAVYGSTKHIFSSIL